jgi:hypothetical protein
VFSCRYVPSFRSKVESPSSGLKADDKFLGNFSKPEPHYTGSQPRKPPSHIHRLEEPLISDTNFNTVVTDSQILANAYECYCNGDVAILVLFDSVINTNLTDLQPRDTVEKNHYHAVFFSNFIAF